MAKKKSKSTSWRARIAFGICVSIPLALCMSWHLLNHRIPTTDAAHYLTHSFRTLDWFREGGMLHGLAGMYLFRFWKPILNASIAVPLLWITGKSVPATVAL